MLLCFVAAGFLLSGNPLRAEPVPVEPAAAATRDGLKADFDAVCAKTDIAMTLSAGEIKELIVRCDELRLRILAQEETARKVYLRRLQMCRDLYGFVLEEKEKGK